MLCKSSSLIAVYANGQAATLRCETSCLVIPPNTLAWRILDSDALVQLAGDGALWMEIEP
jgi:hypothetical protein